MKDTIISAATKRRELYILLACFVVANIVNWAAIIKFSTPWYEIFTQIGYITVTTCVLYGLLLIVRIAWWVFTSLLNKK